MAKNSWDQPNLQEFFRNKKRHNEYDWYVLTVIGIMKNLDIFLIYLQINQL